MTLLQNTITKIAELTRLKDELIQAEKARVGSTKGMSKDQITALAMTMPEFPERLMALIYDAEGFPTGSTVYGNPDTANDIDWCVSLPPHVFEGYVVGTSDEGYWDTDGFQTVYANYRGELLNIICFSGVKLMDAWKEATSAMRTLREIYPALRTSFGPKWSRVRVFRALVDALTPVTRLYKSIPLEDALKYNKCSICGREAINFTCKAARDAYLETGICERHN